MKLSPTQLHYLKKELIRLEIDQEWAHLQKSCPDLVTLSSSASEQQQVATTQDLPFIRFIIHNLIQPFPLIQCQSEQQKVLFWSQWQLFLTEWYQRQPCTWMPPATQEALERRAMMSKFKKMAGLLLGKLIQCDAKEASYHSSSMTSGSIQQQTIPHDPLPSPPLSPPSSSPRDSTTTIASPANIMFGINIVSVQRLDSHHHHHQRLRRLLPTSTKVQHTYFIIETRNISRGDDDEPTLYHVARRHCDFRQLAKRLRSQFPELNDIPTVPAKLRTSSPKNHDSNNENGLPWCEMDRRRLRTFLHKVASNPILRHSPLFHQFLTSSSASSAAAFSHETDDSDDDEGYAKKPSVVVMTTEWKKERDLDLRDVKLRRALDDALMMDQQRYQLHIDATLSSLDQELNELKQLLFRPGGCSELLNVIKATAEWQDLPSSMKKAFEWGRLCFAFTLHKQLVVSDLAMENRSQLEKTHAFMPYRTLSTFMKIYNPMRMVKAILDLFLARPFGGQSLMQRAIWMNLQEEMNTLQKDIKGLEKTMDPMLCEKLYNAVITERRYDDTTVEGLEPIDALLFILKHPDIQPTLTPTQLDGIAFNKSPSPPSVHWKDVQRLWHLYARQQDQTQWMDLLLQGATGTLLQSAMTLLYQPLAQVYQAADLGTTLYELKHFMDDLVQVVGQLQPSSSPSSSSLDSIQPFIDVVKRHETAFYRFVHRVHTQTESPLFTDLIAFLDTWIARTSSSPRQQNDSVWQIEAFWKQVNLTPGQEQALTKELEVICAYHRARKWRQLEKRRLRMRKMVEPTDEEEFWSDEDDDDDDGEEDATSPPMLPPSSIISSLLLPTFVKQVIPLISTK